MDEKLAVEIQKALKELGYYKGEITSKFDEPTKNAYKDFCGWENFEERICDGNFVDVNVLNYLREKIRNKQ